MKKIERKALRCAARRDFFSPGGGSTNRLRSHREIAVRTAPTVEGEGQGLECLTAGS